MASGGARGPDVRKTVGLEVELKLNLPSSCEATNQAVGLAIGGGCGKGKHFFALFLPHAACNAKPPGLPKEVQTSSERLPWGLHCFFFAWGFPSSLRPGCGLAQTV